jgi:uncharacterized protein HemX
MNTFIVMLNDTVALSDSTLIELAKVTNSNYPCIQEAATNYDDVKIVYITCLAIVLVVLIASIAFYHCMRIKYKYQNKEKDNARQHEKDTTENEFERKMEDEDRKINRYIQKAQFDLGKDLSYEKNKSNYQKFGEFVKQVCDSAKDKEGKFDNATLGILLRFFREEWRSSGLNDNHGENSSNN